MMSSLRKELFSLLALVSLPVVLLLIFPFDCIRSIQAVKSLDDECQVCFVELSQEEVRNVISSVRSSWLGGENEKKLKANLYAVELPTMANSEIADVAMRPKTDRGKIVEFGFPSMLPSMAAQPQCKLTVAIDGQQTTKKIFSRRELLELR